MREKGIEDIYEKYASKIYKYIYAFSHDYDVAEEILQETFYSAIKNANKFRNESSIYTWLCKIAKNKRKDHLKKNKKIKFISLDEIEISDNTTIEEEVYNNQKINSLNKAILKCNEETKEVLILRLYANLTFKDIGKVFQKTEQWARTTFYRGKLKIKEELKDE